jgi:hypothetical protein
MTNGEWLILEANLKQTVFLALVSPEPVLNRLALYETSEQKNRHADAGMSILRYALAGYLTGVLGDFEQVQEPFIEPFDDEANIEFLLDGDEKHVTIEYPAWLQDFFSEDARFEYLTADNTVVLAAILSDMRMFCGAHGYMNPEVDEGTHDAEAAQDKDTGSESAEDEADEEADPNPGGDLGKF